MACTLIDVRPVTSCKENLAGTGNKAYIARLTTEQRSRIIVSEDNPIAFLPFNSDSGYPEFHEIVLKSKVNKIDYQSNPNGGGYTATANLVVDKQVDSWAVNSRIMNNTGDWIVLLSTGNADEYYLLGDANYDNEYSDAATTGDAPDSDKGSTITITSGPLRWPYMKTKGYLSPNPVNGSFEFLGMNESGVVDGMTKKYTVNLSESKKSGSYSVVANGEEDVLTWNKDLFYHYLVNVDNNDDYLFIYTDENRNRDNFVVSFLSNYDVDNDDVMSEAKPYDSFVEGTNPGLVVIKVKGKTSKYGVVSGRNKADIDSIRKIEVWHL